MTKTEEHAQCRKAFAYYNVKVRYRGRKGRPMTAVFYERKLTEWLAILDAKERETA